MKLFGGKKEKQPYVTAVIAAAGQSRRMGGENKLLCQLDQLPVLGLTLLSFEAAPIISEIIIAAKEDMVVEYANLAASLKISKLSKVIKGGETRQESVYRAACEANEQAEYIAVHDGARPLITEKKIKEVCQAAFQHHCAALGVPVKDTIKRVSESLMVEETVDRSCLYAMQTPQVADKALLLAALKSAIEEQITVTDECAALERMHIQPQVVLGAYDNLKITTPEDLLMAQAILDERSGL